MACTWQGHLNRKIRKGFRVHYRMRNKFYFPARYFQKEMSYEATKIKYSSKEKWSCKPRNHAKNIAIILLTYLKFIILPIMNRKEILVQNRRAVYCIGPYTVYCIGLICASMWLFNNQVLKEWIKKFNCTDYTVLNQYYWLYQNPITDHESFKMNQHLRLHRCWWPNFFKNFWFWPLGDKLPIDTNISIIEFCCTVQ